jgi:hypothetical protein
MKVLTYISILVVACAIENGEILCIETWHAAIAIVEICISS